jgi:hypothetical protein
MGRRDGAGGGMRVRFRQKFCKMKGVAAGQGVEEGGVKGRFFEQVGGFGNGEGREGEDREQSGPIPFV